ncbi:MAG: GNAT family N-acetyltransferase [Gemmatimonadota bacterium]
MTLTEVIRTYLQIKDPAELIPAPLTGAGIRLEQVRHCPASFHRFLYREVGRNYHWRDRLTWSDNRILEYLEDPHIALFVLYREGAPAGYFELRANDDGSREITYFGLLPEFLGQGLGKQLLSAAVEMAWSHGANRVWLHTCTLDDPAAMPNYVKRGFKPFREERYTTEL